MVDAVDLLVLVATSLTFETTACSILTTGPEAALLLLAVASDRGVCLIGVATAGVDLPAVVAAFFTVVLAAGFAFTTDFTGGFAFFAAPDLLPATAFFAATFGAAFGAALAEALGDFTVLFAGVFFAFAGVDLSGFVTALTTFFAKVFNDDLAGILPAGFAREIALAMGALFFVLFTDFVTVAFMVPVLNELAYTQISSCSACDSHLSHRPGRYPLSSKPR